MTSLNWSGCISDLEMEKIVSFSFILLPTPCANLQNTFMANSDQVFLYLGCWSSFLYSSSSLLSLSRTCYSKFCVLHVILDAMLSICSAHCDLTWLVMLSFGDGFGSKVAHGLALVMVGLRLMWQSMEQVWFPMNVEWEWAPSDLGHKWPVKWLPSQTAKWRWLVLPWCQSTDNHLTSWCKEVLHYGECLYTVHDVLKPL